MNQLQQLMAQSQKMQRQLNKAMAELNEKEFNVTKSGAVTVTMFGSHKIKSIEVDDDAFEKENKDMVLELIRLAVDDLLAQIAEEKEKINEAITGSRNGFGF